MTGWLRRVTFFFARKNVTRGYDNLNPEYQPQSSTFAGQRLHKDALLGVSTDTLAYLRVTGRTAVRPY
jgi:hypothetical protein